MALPLRRSRAAWRLLYALAICGGLAWPAAAAPDFSRTEILVAPDRPVEAGVATFTVVVRNSGDQDAGVVSLMAEWPLMGFLVDIDGLETPSLDHEARSIEASFPLPAGAERRFSVRVLAPRDSANDILTLAVRLNHWASSTEHWDRRSVTIDGRPYNGGVAFGGVRFTPASFAVLGVLAFGALAWVLLTAFARGRRTRAGATATALALTVSVGFFAVFAAMAWRDYQSLTTWRETRCTILGGRLSAQGTTSARTRTSGGTSTRDDTNYVPVLGLRYEVEGRETFSSGYDTGSRVGVGGRGGRTEELAEWAVGATVPCWYDPADALDVVVRNGFGAAYFFALLPLPVFLFGVWQARALLTGR